MSSIRQMTPTDLLRFNSCNLDPLTETYNIGFYIEYFTKWPELCLVQEDREGTIEGYSKLESSPYPPPRPYVPGDAYFRGSGAQGQNYLPLHVHVTCLTVSPAARRLGHASRLTGALERHGDARNAWFVDLFVRKSNDAAVRLYRKMGYSVWRTVKGYYNDGEDAWDMRRPLKRDKGRETVREGGEDIPVDPGEVW
ncbi:N-acetyltransferase 5 [Myriangium duriaei CBS 260.36]|uniref:N-acetyltransferase 5 n=1 Tax=Myriangium duriaei CBS 260.36 TaxID=1168546 RepID=A0A9P4J5U8_9PEZI|nr:N-acetyltransferase 5 [Myriangium duriaei CBS 260.36]